MTDTRSTKGKVRRPKASFGVRFALCISSFALSLGAPIAAFAQGRTLTVDIGTSNSLDGLVANASNFLLITIELLAVVLFIAGAFLFTISRGKEEGLASAGTGKSLMINSMIGLAVVISAHAILRTVLYLLYS